jgi:hypothetical protein
MCDTNSFAMDIFGASLEVASLPLSAMRDTHSSLLNLIGASLVAASLHFCTMLHANPSFALGKLFTSLMLALLAHFAK